MNTRFVKEINGAQVVKTREHIVLKELRTVVDPATGEEYEVEVQLFNPSDDKLYADGWALYEEPALIAEQGTRKSEYTIMQELVAKEFNARRDITNNEALDYMAIIYPWSMYIDKPLEEGTIVIHEDMPWRVRQAHTAQSIYPPSLDTASLYEAIDKEHTGEADDPIPYTPPMEVYEGKYYTQGDVVYICTRDSGTALTHDLSALVGLYFEKYE